jgi:hypothetical protein
MWARQFSLAVTGPLLYTRISVDLYARRNSFNLAAVALILLSVYSRTLPSNVIVY